MNESAPHSGSPTPHDPTRGEYQDPHYHDEDDLIEMNDDEAGWHRNVAPKKKTNRRPPPPRRRYLDD